MRIWRSKKKRKLLKKITRIGPFKNPRIRRTVEVKDAYGDLRRIFPTENVKSHVKRLESMILSKKEVDLGKMQESISGLKRYSQDLKRFNSFVNKRVKRMNMVRQPISKAILAIFTAMKENEILINELIRRADSFMKSKMN